MSNDSSFQSESMRSARLKHVSSLSKLAEFMFTELKTLTEGESLIAANWALVYSESRLFPEMSSVPIRGDLATMTEPKVKRSVLILLSRALRPESVRLDRLKLASEKRVRIEASIGSSRALN